MGYFVGHGRHWQFLRAAGHVDAVMMGHMYRAYLTSQANVLFETGGVRLICEPNVELGIAQLIRDGKIVSAFPYAPGGHDWPIEVHEIYAWPDPIEAQLLGSCHGARVGWFDPHFAQNRDRYKPNSGVQTFRMNALAYRVGRTQFGTAEQESLMGGMRAYMPISDPEASEDELQFVSHVEAVRTLDYRGVPVDVYTVTIALPDDFPMRLDVYTGRALADERLAVGDRITGACWLFGRLVD
jgi:hypothetical protein